MHEKHQCLFDVMSSAEFACDVGGVSVNSHFHWQVAGWVTSSERQIFKMRRAFFKSILRQDMSWFDTNPSGELTTRLTESVCTVCWHT